MKRIVAGSLALLLATAASHRPGLAQAPGSVTTSSEALELTIGGRVQTQFNTTTIADEAPSELILRRARLELEFTLSDLVTGALEPEFAGGEVELKDAYVKLNFTPGFQVLAGNAYKPFSLLEQTSSTRILPIERGARIRGLTALEHYSLVNGLDYSDRDIGVQVMGRPDFLPLGFRYQAGVFRGPLHGESNLQDSYQYAARVTVEPSEVIRLGAGWSSRDFVEAGAPEDDPFERGHAFELDVEVGTFAPGIHFMGEVAFGDAEPDLGGDFFGAQGWLAWRSVPLSSQVSAIEPVVRASYGDSDLGPTTTLLTPGINLYFGGRNRFMVNYDLVLFGGDVEDETEGSFRAQLQLAF